MATRSSEEAFRTFAVDPPYAARTLRSQLLKLKAQNAEQISSGYAKDWSDYQNRVGFLAGLDEAIRLCEEMEKDERK